MPARLRLLGTPRLPTRLGDSSIATHDSLIKNFGVWGAHAKHNQAMQHHAKIISRHAKIVQNELGNRVKSYSPRPYGRYGRECAAEQKKLAPQKKNGKLGETTTADYGGRGRRRPGLHGGGWCRCAALRRGPGPTRSCAGRAADPGGHGPAAFQQGLDYNQPLIRKGPTTTSCCARAKEARALPAGRRAPANQAGQGLLPRQVLQVPGSTVGDHAWQAAQQAERRRGLQGLPVNKLAPGQQVAQRVRQQVEASLTGAPFCSSWYKTTFLLEVQDQVKTLLRQRIRELPAAQEGRAAERLQGQAALRAPATGRAAAERGEGVRRL